MEQAARGMRRVFEATHVLADLCCTIVREDRLEPHDAVLLIAPAVDQIKWVLS
jgi:hypothetical protein